MAPSDPLLHPVRFRIVRAFLGDRALTTGQLAAELDDVPAGSLYRHVALLASSGVLQVVAERRVRGSVERTYTLRLQAASLGPAEAAAMSREDHAQALRLFVAGLVDDFDRYLARPGADPARDGVAYRAGAMWLTDEEHRRFLTGLAGLVQGAMANPPGKGRRRRMVYQAFLPGPEDRSARARSARARPVSARGR